MKSLQFAKKAIQKTISLFKEKMEEGKYQEISSRYDLNGFKRIYLIHIRKTGGTALNNMFLSLSGEDPSSLFNQLAKAPSHRLISGSLSYIGWNVRCINKGNYFYGFSHTPLYKLNLPKHTFTVSCFRDPVKRVVSHYNMLMDFRENNIDHPCMETEGKWLGEDFNDFLQKIPQEHLLNQLYMFSSHYDINEAVLNVQRLSHYFFSDTFTNGINELNKKTGLALQPIHIRKSSHHTSITDDSLTKLKDMLNKEYLFLNKIRELQYV